MNVAAKRTDEPKDVYDINAWNQFYKENPNYRRSVGAEGDNPPNDPPPSDPPADDPPSDPPKEPPNDPPKEPVWRDTIKDEKARKFADQFNTVEDAVKSALNFRQKLSNAVSIPKSDASEEEWNEYYTKLGRPNEATEYTVETELPEEQVKPIIDSFQESFFKAGLTKTQGATILGDVLNILKETEDSSIEDWNKQVQAGEDALKKEWGSEYETNSKYADRAAAQFGGAEFNKLLETSEYEGVKLSNHPLFKKTFSEIGRKMGEGGLKYVATESDTQTFNEEQDRLTREAQSALDSGNKDLANQLFTKRDKLARQYYGQ